MISNAIRPDIQRFLSLVSEVKSAESKRHLRNQMK